MIDNFKTVNNFKHEINNVWDIAVYLQMMAAFCDDIDFNSHSSLMLELYDFIEKSDEQEIKKKLPLFKKS